MISFNISDINKNPLIALINGENEVTLVYPAELITSEILTKMWHSSHHLIGLALPPTRSGLKLPFSNSLDNRLAHPVTIANDNYGLPIVDAIHTIRSLIDEQTHQQYLSKGLVYPVITKAGTSLVLPDTPELAFDLMTLGGFKKGAIFCSLFDEDGKKLTINANKILEELEINKIYVDEIIEHRLKFEPLVERTTCVKLPTEYGEFQLNVYKNKFDKNNNVNLALTIGDIKNSTQVPFVRVHSEWSIANIINRLAVEDGSHLNLAMKKIAEKGIGVILLLYNTPDKAMDLSVFSNDKAQVDIWIEDEKVKTLQVYQNSMSLGLGSQILRDLGITKMRLLTSSQKSFDSVLHYGLEIVEKVKF